MLLIDFFESVYRPLKLRNRSANTIRLYRYSIRCFERFLQRNPTLEDLTDEQVSLHLAYLTERKLSPYSVNKERSQLLAMWGFAARKRLVEKFPDVDPEITPKRVPIAWMEDDMRKLMTACAEEPGELAGIPAALWWIALHRLAWNTAERISAMLALTWDFLGSDGWIKIPAEIRKCKREDKLFQLGEDTLAALHAIREPVRRKIFPWPYSETYLWPRYKKILQRAGLPTDAKSKFHRLRRTAATYFELAGGSAMDLLGHSHRETTKLYLDPRILKVKQPSEILFKI